MPYPLRPLNILRGCSGLRCTNRDSIAIFPQVSWEFGCISPPTDFTDLHRWFCCVCSPTDFTEFTEVRLHKSSHRFHGFAQMVGCVNSPTEFTEFTEVWLRKSSHRFHGFARSLGGCWLRGYGRMPYPPTSVRIRAHLWEPLLSQKVLCVPWVLWEYSLPRISQINTDGWLH